MRASTVVRQSLWVYLGGNISSVLGFVFWIVVSRYVSLSVVGSVAAVLALQAMLSSLTGFGFSAGLQRLLSQTRGEGDSAKLRSRFFSSLKFQLALGLLTAAIIAGFSACGIHFLALTETETTFVIVLYLLTFWPPIFIAICRVFLRTAVPAAAQVVSSALKTVICIPLLLLGSDFTGIMLAIISATVVFDIIIVIFTFTLLGKNVSDESTPSSFYIELLKSGLPSWVPNTLTTVATSVGILLIYGLVSKGQTGLYSIAFAISAVVLTLPSSVHGMMFPVLSSMTQDREEAISRAMKIASMFTAPLAITFALYSIVPLSILGPAYEPASVILSVLVLAALLTPLVSAYSSYAYALGKYSHVMAIGIVVNLGRFILYFPLVSTLEAYGAAIAFASGVLLGVLMMVPLARRTSYRVNYTQYATIVLIPTILGCFLFYLSTHWIIGALLLMVVPFVIYGRTGILTKDDARKVLLGFLASTTVDKIQRRLSLIIKLLFIK